MPTSRDREPENRLLRSLPSADLAGIRHRLRPVELPGGKVLYQPGSALDYVYFPEDAIVASLAGEENGPATEVATTGGEGLVSVGAITGDRQAAFRHVVRVPGTGQRVEFRAFEKLLTDFPAFRDRVHKYSRAFLIQVMQSAGCNANHSVRQRFARRLLMYHDRVSGDEICLTQELLAETLGVSRVAINSMANEFQREGLLRNSRGTITVANRNALQDICCDCYVSVRRHYDRLLPGALTK